MKNLRTKLLAVFLLTISSSVAFGQLQTKQVIVVSGGVFGTPGNMVEFGSYNPQTKNFMVFDSVPGSYTNDAIVDGNHAYVTADSTIYKYDISTYTRLDSVVVPGIQRLAVSDDYLIVTQGFGASSMPYARFFDKSTLTPVTFQNNYANDLSEGVFVRGNTAYVAVTGSWPDYLGYGLVVTFDLVNKTGDKRIPFPDTDVKVTNSVYEYQGYIVAVSSKNGSIALYDPSDFSFDYFSSPNTVRGIDMDGDLLWIQTSTGAKAFDLSQQQFSGTHNIQAVFERGAADTLNDLLYMGQTDFFSYGKVMVSDYSGNFTDSFVTGISPQAIAIQYGHPTNIAEEPQAANLSIYPNPASEIVTIQADVQLDQLRLFDVTGKKVRSTFIPAGVNRIELSLANLPSGVYYIKAGSENGIYTSRLIKQ